LVEITEMLQAHYEWEERLGDIIAYGTNVGFTGKKPKRRTDSTTKRSVESDRQHLLKMMRGDADPEPVELTPELVETVFANEVKGAKRVDILPPQTEPDQDVAADVRYLRALDRLLKEEHKEN
jgi:hypothetical protein